MQISSKREEKFLSSSSNTFALKLKPSFKTLLISLLSLTIISSLILLSFYSPSLISSSPESKAIRSLASPIKDEVDLSFSEEDHRKLSRKYATEGMVLAKNTGLPIQATDKVVLFGKGTKDTIYGGWGSGEVYNKGTKNGMTPIKVDEGIENKAKENKLIYQKNEKGLEIYNGLQESDIENFAKKDNNAKRCVAVMTISRKSGEDSDRTLNSAESGVYITDNERKTYQVLEKYFDQVVVVLNVGSVMEIGDFIQSEKTSILISYLPGMEAGNAIADVLVGDVNPSGHLSDTWALKIQDYPTTTTFLESNAYVKYKEGIFVGYRYFEDSEDTQAKVVFPFGWGLSYTTFEISSSKVEYENEVFKLLTTVENTGEVAGREVVQVYIEKPANEKFVKAKRELVAFGKTKLLEPGDKQTLALTVDLYQLTSYDDAGVTGNKACYVLDKGDYNFYVANNVGATRDENTKVYTHTVEEITVVKKLTTLLTPTDNDVKDANTKPNFSSFMKSSSTSSAYLIDSSSENNKKIISRINPDVNYPSEKESLIKEPFSFFNLKANDINFKTVIEGKNTMEELVNSMSDDQLAYLTVGHSAHICNGPGTLGGDNNSGTLGNFLVPSGETADGPAGLRHCENSIQSTAWPSSTLLASTFDPEILESVGLETGKEARKIGVSFWLAPGMNIHRSPLCGRNFEYYSEDPYLSGKLAAAITKGLQKTRVSITLKHFAFNNKEANRRESDSRVSERAAREVYLKGWEIAVKEGKPWAMMTSYNKVNGVFASANHDLLTGILREEWGYDGLVMTDWVNDCGIVDEIRGGGNVKMPFGNNGDVVNALRSGKITKEQLQQGALYICNTLAKTAAIEQIYK